MERVDTVVIGAGPGGLAAAYPLAQTQKVVVVETDLWGGTCPNRGCDPKKMLYSAVEAKQSVSRMHHHGISGDVSVDWPELMAFKRSYTSSIPKGTKGGLDSAGIQTVHGQATFVDSHTLKVGSETFEASSFIVATGEKARALDISGANLLGTSTDFLDMDNLPQRMVFIGGGYISFELANIAAVAGSSVTLIQHNDRPLKAFPQELVNQLMDLMRGNGIDIRLNTEISSASRGADGKINLETSQGTISADAVINATGRQPNIDGLNLAAAGVKTDSHGIVVDDRLRTANASISAIGDVVSRKQPKLTPVAGFEGRYVASRLLGQTSAAIKYPEIPTVVFGAEKLAQIGVSVNDAREDEATYSVTSMDTTSWYTYNRVQDPKASVMVVKKRSDDSVVGIAALSSVADEVINQYADTLNPGVKPIYAYPTPASDTGYFG